MERMDLSSRKNPKSSPRAGQVEPPAAAGILEKASEELRRMRYFRDLLELGYRHALSPGEEIPTLRTQRLALGIALPELDVVPLWSWKGTDGTLSIPFGDFLLNQFLESLERFRRTLRDARQPRAMLRGNPTSFRTKMETASGKPNPLSLPVLEDRHLPEASLARLCGPDGVLNRILRRCENNIWGGTMASARTTQA